MTRPFFTLLLFVLSYSLLAQDEIAPCGTGNIDYRWLDSYLDNPSAYPRSDDLLYVPLTVHITGTDEGVGYFPVKSVLDALCRLNLDFLETNIQFYVKGEFRYINNTAWHTHDNGEFGLGIQMMLANNVPNTLNSYLTASAAGACGYYAPSGNGIVMQKACLSATGHTWAHEVGHFLSLPHPFRGWEIEEAENYDYSTPAPLFWGSRQVEKVDGSNCTVAGDRFCDTPPDYLNYRWGCTSSGLSTQLQYDPDTVAFQSDASLIMSYSFDACSSRFSPEQIAAMRANILDARPGLLSDPPEVIDDITEVEGNILTPAEESTTPFSDIVNLSWETIPNATHYIVQVSALPIFSGPKEEYVIQDTAFTLTDLDPDRRYWWRIRPYNHFGSFCTEFIDTSSFTTGLLTNVNQLEEALQLVVYPNPVASSNFIQVAYLLEEQQEVQIRLFSASGQLVYQQQSLNQQGPQNLEISTANLPKGIYLLQLANQRGNVSRKISIQ
ncbi:MAG: T9SS type A sorting domain-containing protein [Bacteroidota bacterium]